MLYIKNTQLNKLITLFIFSVLALSACNDDDHSIIPDFEITEEIDRVYLTNTSVYENHGSVSWHSSAPDIKIEHVTGDRYYFMLPDRDVPENINITMKIRVGDATEEITKSMTLRRLEQHQKYGLGYSLTKEVSNNVDYEWYVDQGNTGKYSLINCGPACTQMALKWAKPNFSVTAEELRNKIGHADWWNIGIGSEIHNVLTDENAEFGYIRLETHQNLIDELDEGNIAIVNPDIYYIRELFTPEWRIDKFYKTSSTQSGHFIIIKGYKIIDGACLFEVYDPWSLGEKYKNGEYKGKDRYYRAEDVMVSTRDRWWGYALIVSKYDNKKSDVSSSNWIDRSAVMPAPRMSSPNY